MDSKRDGPSVVMLPWLAHGHISPFLSLAKRLSHRHFHIHLCSTPVNLKPFRENLRDDLLSSIHLIDIHLPSIPHLPPHFHTTKNLPPHLMPALKAAFDAAKPAFCTILNTLKPSLVIYDYLQPWVPIAAREENIEAVLFLSSGAASCSFMTHCSIHDLCAEYPFPALRFPEAQCRKMNEFLYYTSNGLQNRERFLGCIKESSSMVLIKTAKELEAKYIDYLSVLAGKEVVSVGPLVDHQNYSTDHHKFDATDDDGGVIMEWLSKKDKSSVAFVSFGSEYFLSKEEIEEIAHGLELSEVNFIWVIRFHGGERNRSALDEVLPEGFLKRVGERGMVVEGWAPQVKILGHSSIGGFVTHCGWSSTLEGLMFGVPIIGMPMQLDQPLNAKFVVEMGVGMEIERENERYRREEVARVIKDVMMLERGKEVRERVREVGGRMREAGDEDVDVVVEKLVQLARKRQ